MKTKSFRSEQRNMANGGRLYGRQWLCKCSSTLQFREIETHKVFWPVYL